MNDHLLKIKTLALLDFEIAKKNAHVLDEKDYWKLNNQISFGDLFWLIEHAEKVEKLKKQLSQLCPDCGFEFNAMHEVDEQVGGWECPLCEVDELQKEIERLKSDGERGYDILANVRDILLPLVNPIGNACGDMGACTVSNPECIKCLAEQIRGQFED